MVADTGTLVFITFLLGVTGYLGLTIVVILSLQGYIPSLAWGITTIIILAHVAMIWLVRYDLQFSLAVRNGYSGFIIFHSALFIILLSHLYKSKALLFIRLSFLIVTTGAVGAVFRYNVVAMYKIPVIVCAIAGCTGLIWMLINSRKQTLLTK